MTGKYKVILPMYSWLDKGQFHKNWSVFVKTCESLHRDGLDYEVALDLASIEGGQTTVTITASGQMKARKDSKPKGHVLPMPIPAEVCKLRAIEAEWFLPEHANRRNTNTNYWAKHRSRHAELEAMAEDERRAEAEYWREMELLSGQRDHLKPGRGNNLDGQDDEVKTNPPAAVEAEPAKPKKVKRAKTAKAKPAEVAPEVYPVEVVITKNANGRRDFRYFGMHRVNSIAAWMLSDGWAAGHISQVINAQCALKETAGSILRLQGGKIADVTPEQATALRAALADSLLAPQAEPAAKVAKAA